MSTKKTETRVSKKQSSKSANGKKPFVYEQTGTCGPDAWRIRWEIPPRAIPKLERFAKIFEKPTILSFLRAWESHSLPGQIRQGLRDPNLLNGAKVTISGLDAKAKVYLAGAAKYCRESVEKSTLRAINGDIVCTLENCLVHPTTGEMLELEFPDRYRTRVDVERALRIPARTVTSRG